ncbi:MAG: molybdopterin-dependent oxidoreductase [Pseudomonadota bacterium]
MASKAAEAEWKPTACGLCYANCGVLVQTGGEDGRRILRVKGDKNHPVSKGYTCNKALKLDYYVHGRDRLTAPLRRREDGTFEEIDWDTAISEVASKMAAIRDEHGGDKIFRYGGGGQGNHLGGAYFGSVMAALGMKYKTNALAQEKTGFGWMMNRMFGGGVHGELHEAQTLVIVGKNPWQSNGFQRARILLRQASKDPERTLIVMDPKRTESAELADIHLAVKPGRDAWALSAMVAHILQEDLVPHDWLDAHTIGFERVLDRFKDIPVDEYCHFAGLDPADVKAAAEAIGKAETAALYEDIGLQMAPHSTLDSYLNMLLTSITGHFGRPGTMAVLSHLPGPFFSGSDQGEVDEDGYEHGWNTSPVTGSRIVGGLVPCNDVPDAILTDHPDRYRAMFVESGNPAHSMADSPKWREALRALDLLVVFDIAMTETAMEADYILPAPSQYEKWEATFFNFEYPANVHHLRKPVIEPKGNVLPEPEIHSRIVEALDVIDEEFLEPLHEAAKQGLEAYGMAAFAFMAQHPKLTKFIPHILYRTLGPTLPEGAASGALYWGMCQRFAAANAEAVKRAGHEGEGLALGNALFEAIISGHSGTVFSVEDFDEAFSKIGFDDNKIRLNVGEMLDEVDGLAAMEDVVGKKEEFPFILAAGERRSNTANCAIRDPKWMEANDATSLAIHPSDAAKVGIGDGANVKIITEIGEAIIDVRHDDRQKPGSLAMPNGLGMLHPNEKGDAVTTGASCNELTPIGNKDKFVGTPFHKYVPARLERI